jgi:hypothetical protein
MLKIFSIPAATLLGFFASCSTLSSQGSSEKESQKGEKQTPQSTPTAKQNGSGQSYSICELTNPPSDAFFTVCTKEFVDARILDGKSCSYKTCASQNDTCPQYYVTKKSSSPPENSACHYFRPIEL